VTGAPVRVALAGPMGAGKSTVARLLAVRWCVPFLDLDAEIGDIPAIFSAEGEAAFRLREAEVLARLASGHGVLALGGGTVVDPANRALLREWTVVVLMGPVAALRARIGGGEGRPLAANLEALLRAREAAYRAAGPWVDTEGLEPRAVADRVEALCTSP